MDCPQRQRMTVPGAGSGSRRAWTIPHEGHVSFRAMEDAGSPLP